MNRLEFYKDLYFAELERKEELRTALTLPIGILTVLGGVIAIYLREIGRAEMLDVSISFLGVFTFLLIMSFLATVRNLVKSYHVYTYDFVPYATDLEQAYQDLVVYHETVEEAEADFESSVLQSLVIAHRKNAFNNDSKSSHIHNANQTLIYCLVLALICAIPYFLRTLDSKDVVQRIEIVNPTETENVLD
ncbi:MAG TPA: hypothetical protein VKP65_08645 [Rhodothermales bacterium]|nr:hypothetical protein [Rhodothermales bacterium]